MIFVSSFGCLRRILSSVVLYTSEARHNCRYRDARQESVASRRKDLIPFRFPYVFQVAVVAGFADPKNLVNGLDRLLHPVSVSKSMSLESFHFFRLFAKNKAPPRESHLPVDACRSRVPSAGCADSSRFWNRACDRCQHVPDSRSYYEKYETN